MTGRARADSAGPAAAALRPGGAAPAAAACACWAICVRAEVPPGDDWLGQAERSVLARLRIEKRRNDFRVGRWAARQALADALAGLGHDLPLANIEIVPAPDGAPEPRLAGLATSASVSLSHSGEIGFAVACAPALPLGCDVERVEPRSARFVRDYFTTAEAALVESAPADGGFLATLLWSAKESALKLRREGLRADTRSVAVSLTGAPADAGEGCFTVEAADAASPLWGRWWRREGYVFTIVAACAGEPPAWPAPGTRGCWSMPLA